MIWLPCTTSGKTLCCRISCRLRYWNHQRFTPDFHTGMTRTAKIWKITPSTGSKFITWSILPDQVINTMFWVSTWFLTAYETINKRRLPVRAWRPTVSGIGTERISPDSRLEKSRIAHTSGGKIIGRTGILSQYKTLHNSTDVDTVKRAIRAIEIEGTLRKDAVEEREFTTEQPDYRVDIDRSYATENHLPAADVSRMPSWESAHIASGKIHTYKADAPVNDNYFPMIDSSPYWWKAKRTFKA